MPYRPGRSGRAVERAAWLTGLAACHPAGSSIFPRPSCARVRFQRVRLTSSLCSVSGDLCPMVYLSVYLSACLSVCLSVCPSIYLSVYRFVLDWSLRWRRLCFDCRSLCLTQEVAHLTLAKQVQSCLLQLCALFYHVCTRISFASGASREGLSAGRLKETCGRMTCVVHSSPRNAGGRAF